MRILLIAFIMMQYLLVQAGQSDTIAKGSIKGPYQWKSKIYPGTERNYWIYIPKQYDAGKPSCLMVVQDGLSRAIGWRLPAILDSLITFKAIPVLIGLFIDPGIVPAADTSLLPRFNRSVEYDALGDRYARFLLEEMIPEISREYNISKNPNDRSIAGASSGAICAFNVAWERPDAFRRVFSSIGTYVGLRGGHEFPTLVRKTEPKPLRVFLQDGTRDNNIYAGDWWVANQDMLSALTWAGYEVNHAWGEGGGHDSRHTITILADALLWLWKDYPSSVKTHPDSIIRINPILKDQCWEEIRLKGIRPQLLAINNSGDLFFNAGKSVYKYVDKESPEHVATFTGKVGGLSFNKDGKLYVSNPDRSTIGSIDKNGRQLHIIENVDASSLTISSKGIYFINRSKKRIGFYSFATRKVLYYDVPATPADLSLSGEQTFLSLAFRDIPLGYSFRLSENGELHSGQEYIHYHIPYGQTTSGITALVTDTANLLYSASRAGIQMSDQLGRVNFIISNPADFITDIKIGGPGFNILYANCNGRLFRRTLNTKGVLPWLPPVKSPRPRL